MDNGARIVNLSIAGTSTPPVERAAIRYTTARGVLLIAAAGNAAQDGNPRTYPAALLGHGGLVVGAATQRGTRRLFAPASIESYGYGSGTCSTDLAFGNVDVAAAVARAQSRALPVLTYPQRP